MRVKRGHGADERPSDKLFFVCLEPISLKTDMNSQATSLSCDSVLVFMTLISTQEGMQLLNRHRPCEQKTLHVAASVF